MRRTYRSTAEAAEPPGPTFTGDVVTTVYAQVLRYLLAGLCVTIIVWVLAGACGYFVAGFLPAVSAGLVTGAAIGLRGLTRNEADTEWLLWEGRRALARIEQLEAEKAALTLQRDSALRDAAAANEAAATWQREVHQRRAPTFVPPQPPAESPAVHDARRLLTRRYGRGEPVSKEYMAALPVHPWSADRYLAATAVLGARGFFTPNNRWRAFASEAEALAQFHRSPTAPVVADS